MATTVCADGDDFSVSPDGSLKINTGCGIKSTTDGLAADVAVWPYACDQAANATPIFCGENGQLQGPPEFRSKTISVNDSESDDQPVNPDKATNFTLSVPVDLSNWCEAGIADLSAMVLFGVTAPAGSDFTVALEREIDGGGFVSLGNVYRETNSNAGIKAMQLQVRDPLSLTAANHTIRYRMIVENESTSPGQIVVTFRGISVRGIVITRHD